jgi:hypothetical protein
VRDDVRLFRSPAFNSPLTVALLTLFCYGTFTAVLWNARNRDITRFIVLGSTRVIVDALPPGLAVTDGDGYDGTAFYRLALDPFTDTAIAYGITLDSPSYRQQRIGYPIIVWLLSFGQIALIPYLMVAVNLAAVMAIGGVGAMFARAAGRHCAWGALCSFYPGFLYSVSRDLAEPVACAFGIGSLLAIQYRRDKTAAVLIAAAVLSRETFLIVALAALIAFVASRIAGSASSIRPLVFVVPLGVYALWQVVLAARWQTFAAVSGPSQFTLPLVEYVDLLLRSSSLRRGLRIVFTQAVYVGMCVALTAIAIRRSSAATIIKISWLLQLALAVTLPHVIWEEDVGFMRILSDLSTTGAAVLIWAKPPVRWIAMIASGIVWYYVASHLVKYT